MSINYTLTQTTLDTSFTLIDLGTDMKNVRKGMHDYRRQ